MLYTVIVLFAGLVAGHPVSLEPDWDQSKGLFPSGIYLVRGKAIKIDRKRERRGYFETATFLIEHAYVGEALVKGQTFQVEVASILGLRPAVMDDKFSFKDGEVGIWWVRRDRDTKRLVADIRAHFYQYRVGGFGPARDVPGDECFDPLKFGYFRCNSYAKGVMWAEKYEKLYKTAAKDQVALLKQYARGKEPLLAGRAVNLLAFCGMTQKEYMKCLTDLAQEKNLSVGAELAIDDALHWKYYRDKEQLKAWYTSSNHLRSLTNWVSNDLGDRETTVILELDICHRFVRLQANLEHLVLEYLDYPTLLRIVLSGIANEKRSSRFKTVLMQAAKDCRPKDPTGVKASFDYLVGEVQSGATAPIRVAAARLLTTLKPFSEGQRAKLTSILKKTKNENVIRYLKEAMQEGTEKKHNTK